MFSFTFFEKEEIKEYLSPRPGEQKLGEKIALLSSWRNLSKSQALFVLIGLQEDMGVQANQGLAGSATAFPAFLKSFLNIQETNSLPGSKFILGGYLKITSENSIKELSSLRKKVEQIDEIVFPLVEEIIRNGKIPVVIGGGHNNAFPILKGSSLARKHSVNAINIDAHSDFRQTEGRHSGNGFRYAYEQGFLKKYALLGLHEAYNQQMVVTELKSNPDFQVNFWEDIFLRENLSWADALKNALQHVDSGPFGVELDLDCIENTLSSALSPIGITGTLTMKTLYVCGKNNNAIYLHLPEGIAEREDGLTSATIGKLLSYLVQAFCKGVLERK